MKRELLAISCCVPFAIGCASSTPPAKTAETAKTTEPAKSAEPAATTAPERIVITDVGFATPESVLYDEASDTYLVANINGSPLEADGNGFISRVSPDGTVTNLKWIDGTQDGIDLDSPKGMAIQGGVLYVADLTRVRMFDLASGAAKGSVDVPGSTFLNDMCDGPDGSVYVTDSGLKGGEGGFVPSGTDAIYQIKADGSLTAIAKGDALGRPNGILAEAGGVKVVTFGTGAFYTIDATGKREESPTPPKGALDGLIRLEDGRYVVSSWGGSAIYVLEDGKFSVLAEDLDAPADIGFDSKRKRVLVPLFKQNKVVILPL